MAGLSKAVSGRRDLIYFADPMCSWCWGFSPVIEMIRTEYGDRLPIRLILGGLRAGNTVPMGRSMAADIRSHWQHVEQATGQTFDFRFFDRRDFVYDTAPACRALVAVRTVFPGRELDVLKHFHQAFYRRNEDLTQAAVLCRLVAECGLSEAAFRDAYESEASETAFAADLSAVLENGIRAFPALLGGSPDDGYMTMTHGWRSFEELKPSLDRLLAVEQLPRGMMPGMTPHRCTP